MHERQRAVMPDFFHDAFNQRGFTFPVLSRESDLVTPLDHQIGITENGMLPVRF